MTDIIVKRFGQAKEIAEGMYPIFGFAVQDYMAKYNLKPEDVEKMYIWGAILEESDDCDEVFEMLNYISLSDHVALFIFDINNVSNDVVKRLKELLETYEEYSELEGVYEDRIVFGRIM